MLTQHTTTRDAGHPFDQHSADITLHTSDSVCFHVHSQILSQASPVFATILSLPQPADNTHLGSPGRPVVHLAEDSNALEPLLRICYPVHKPVLQHLDEIQPALETAIKFDMKWPTEELIGRFLTCAAQDPFRVWAFGCRHGLEHVARGGAEALRVSLLEEERKNIVFLPT
uniref:FAD-binding FR-type domain-containing protein n=1 Tax=Ganoderma boninense TaxID=34458 RepID=A0A5K1K286_9APHY|nr:FAD-binding FR-type domain-containing protein [Ganoderma boninense]